LADRSQEHPCDVPSLRGPRAWGQAEVGPVVLDEPPVGEPRRRREIHAGAGGHGASSRPTGHRQQRRVLDPSPPAKAATRTPASASHGRGSPPAPEEPPRTTATHRDRETAAAIPFGPTRGVARPPLKDPSLLRTQSGSPRYLFTNRSDDFLRDLPPGLRHKGVSDRTRSPTPSPSPRGKM